ncbi:unnamed protein product, partial [Psylliodes chrysocephalus]
IFFGFFGVYQAAPAELSDSKSARILKFDYDDSGKGPYRYGFESSDGITKEESGEVHYAGTKREFIKVTGVYSYPGPDGVMYEVRYTADDQGFHPEGDHIKVPPFVPWVHHDDETNDIDGQVPDSANFESGQYISEVVRTTPKPEYLPSTTTSYLPSTPSSTPKPTYTSGENILETFRPQENCLQCSGVEQESNGSAPGPNTVYLPSTVGPTVADDALNHNLLSTPRPNPEIHFHSTAEPQIRNFRDVSPTTPQQMMLIIGPMGLQMIPVMK